MNGHRIGERIPELDGLRTVLVMALTQTPAAAAAAFRHVTLRTLGRYSYALDIVHVPIAFFVSRHVVGLWGGTAPLTSFAQAQTMFNLLAGSASLLVAVASWHGIEKYFLALKDRFPYNESRVQSEPSAPVAV